MTVPRPWRGRPLTAMEAAFIEAEKTRKTKMTDTLKFQGRVALTNTVVEFQVPQEMVGDEEAWALVEARNRPGDRYDFSLQRVGSRHRWHHGYQGRTMARLVLPHATHPGLELLNRFGNSPAWFAMSEDRSRLDVTVDHKDIKNLRQVDRRRNVEPAAPVDLAALSAAVRAINEAVTADPDLSLSLVDGRVRLALIKELG